MPEKIEKIADAEGQELSEEGGAVGGSAVAKAKAMIEAGGKLPIPVPTTKAEVKKLKSDALDQLLDEMQLPAPDQWYEASTAEKQVAMIGLLGLDLPKGAQAAWSALAGLNSDMLDHIALVIGLLTPVTWETTFSVAGKRAQIGALLKADAEKTKKEQAGLALHVQVAAAIQKGESPATVAGVTDKVLATVQAVLGGDEVQLAAPTENVVVTKPDPKPAKAKPDQETAEASPPAPPEAEDPAPQADPSEAKPTPKGTPIAAVPVKEAMASEVPKKPPLHIVGEKPNDPLQAMAHEIENLKDQGDVEARIKEMQKSEGENDFKLGGLLQRLTDLFVAVDGGPQTVKEHIESVLGIKYGKARYLIRNYTGLLGAQIPWDTVSTLGWTKINILLPVLTPENVREWVKKAKALNNPSLQAEVDKALKGDQEKQEQVASNLSTFSAKVAEDQKAVIDEALQSAMLKGNTEHKGVALTWVCQEYLGSTPGKAEVKLGMTQEESQKFIRLQNKLSKSAQKVAVLEVENEELKADLDAAKKGAPASETAIVPALNVAGVAYDADAVAKLKADLAAAQTALSEAGMDPDEIGAPSLKQTYERALIEAEGDVQAAMKAVLGPAFDEVFPKVCLKIVSYDGTWDDDAGKAA